jgi:hypothetical protein
MKSAILFALLLCGMSGTAQKRTAPPDVGTTMLRFNPLGLLDIGDQNFSVGAERFLKPNFSVASDVAVIFNSTRYELARSSTGFIFRPAVRYYPRYTGFYIEGELHFKQVNHQVRDWLGMDAVNGVPTYERFTDFTYRRNIYGFHFKAGRIMPSFLGTNLWWEVYAGLGIRHYDFAVVGQPRSIYQGGTWFDFTNDNNIRVLAVVPMGMRVMYRMVSGER